MSNSCESTIEGGSPRMGVTIGFVIVSHDKPAQLLRLVRRLMMLYDNPPIVCHHDFSKCSLEGYDFPKEVMFVRPHIVTKWAGISFVHAYLAALRILYQLLHYWPD
jgi:hypothetical protein